MLLIKGSIVVIDKKRLYKGTSPYTHYILTEAGIAKNNLPLFKQGPENVPHALKLLCEEVRAPIFREHFHKSSVFVQFCITTTFILREESVTPVS